MSSLMYFYFIIGRSRNLYWGHQSALYDITSPSTYILCNVGYFEKIEYSSAKHIRKILARGRLQVSWRDSASVIRVQSTNNRQQRIRPEAHGDPLHLLHR
jgi:hypothetical protein